MFRRIYTPELDERILQASSAAQVAVLAEEIGVTFTAIRIRRAKLRKQQGIGRSSLYTTEKRNSSPNHYIKPAPTVSTVPKAPPDRFARPDWFSDRDLIRSKAMAGR